MSDSLILCLDGLFQPTAAGEWTWDGTKENDGMTEYSSIGGVRGRELLVNQDQ